MLFRSEDIGYDQDTILECICEYLCGVFPHEFTEISIDNVQQYLSEQKKSLEKKETAAKEIKENKNLLEEAKTSNQSENISKAKKLSYKEQKEFEQLEKDIETIEARKSELETLMSGTETDYGKIASMNKEYQALSSTLEEKYARWEELA